MSDLRYRIDLRSGELRRNGERVPLQDLPFRLLGLLAQRPGQVVPREDLQRELWPDKSFADFEDGLNTAIRKLRQALQDDPREPTYIETIRGYGYRLLVPMDVVSGAVGAPPAVVAEPALAGEPAEAAAPAIAPVPAAPPPLPPAPAPPVLRLSPAARWTAALGVALIGAVMLWWTTPLPPAQPGRISAITSSGRLDYCMRAATDGARLFFLERGGDHWTLKQTSMRGGEAATVTQPFLNAAVFDVSPDGGTLLIGSFVTRGGDMDVWTMSAQGGVPKRVGSLQANDAVWSHSGTQIALAKGDELLVAAPDGSGLRRVARLPGSLDWPAFSPDDTHIRVTLIDPLTNLNSIWDVGVDGSHPAPILTDWKGDANLRYGTWSRDGSYYAFNSDHDGRYDVWILREHTDSWRRSPAGPFRLTDGPFQPLGATISPDASRVYFCGNRHNFEMQAYDLTARTMSPYLPATNPQQAVFTRDGGSLAFVDPEAMTLWRSEPDGSNRRLLSDGWQDLGFPRWSPDGAQLMFTARPPHGQQGVYAIGRDGGTPALVDARWVDASTPDWSPDGRSVVVSRLIDAQHDTFRHKLSIEDLAAHTSVDIPGGEDYSAPRWSPARDVIAATSESGHAVGLYNVNTGRWVSVGDGKLIGISVWSNDGAYLYFQDLLGEGEPLFRVRPDGTHLERVADFSDLLGKGVTRYGVIGMTPEGKMLFMVTRAESDMYAVGVGEK